VLRGRHQQSARFVKRQVGAYHVGTALLVVVVGLVEVLVVFVVLVVGDEVALLVFVVVVVVVVGDEVVLLVFVVLVAVVLVLVLEPAPTATPVYEPAASSKSATFTLPPRVLIAKLKIANLVSDLSHGTSRALSKARTAGPRRTASWCRTRTRARAAGTCSRPPSTRTSPSRRRASSRR
jgi:hypothetical protein